MHCLHPRCPFGDGTGSWAQVVSHLSLKPVVEGALLSALSSDYGHGLSTSPTPGPLPPVSSAVLDKLLLLCPCLFNQLPVKCTPRGVVHLCELTLKARIDNSNVHKAFFIQHPSKGPPYLYPPIHTCSDGGTIMEMLCSELLESNGIPRMSLDEDDWPVWMMPGHILLNEGKMAALRAFGDILIPTGPTNLVVSVKSEAARERLLYSANSIEGIGFGFFNKPSEFWTERRMNLYKRMGFSAIYLPDETYEAIVAKLKKKGLTAKAVNVNGTELYRPLSVFAEDIRRVVGRHSLLL